jgi:hypothetical protein
MFSVWIRLVLMLSMIIRMKKLTKALCGGSFEEVVDGCTDDNPLAARMHSESTDLDTVTTSDVLDERRLTHNFDQFLTSVAILVEVADISG